jgi:hypothetical protein
MDASADNLTMTRVDDLASVDDLVRQAEELCTLAVDPERTMFSKTEVIDLALDMRSVLLRTRDRLAAQELNG